MKVLVIGGGGREHALAWRLAQSEDVVEVIASPGNPGISQVATCIPAPPKIEGYVDLAEKFGVSLTVVGPEALLVAGIVDRFRTRGLHIIGPTQAAARLEGSKIFAKQFFRRAGIPTAASVETSTIQEAREALNGFGNPVVIKADGLAAGKGVVIATTPEEAAVAVSQLGPNLVLEEYLDGEEVSFIGLSDGLRVLPFAPSQDHKRIYDGDRGPNTGGMGAYCDTRILSSAQTGDIMERVMNPAIRQMNQEGTPFTGFLYAGLMMTSDGPRLLEFNARLGDPEAQALLYSFRGDLPALLRGQSHNPAWETPSVCIVLASEGYPVQPVIGDIITGIPEAERLGAVAFHAGTARRHTDLVTSGGRVLGITASGKNLPAAIHSAYQAASTIRFRGMQFRKDIGQKGLRRW